MWVKFEMPECVVPESIDGFGFVIAWGRTCVGPFAIVVSFSKLNPKLIGVTYDKGPKSDTIEPDRGGCIVERFF